MADLARTALRADAVVVFIVDRPGGVMRRHTGELEAHETAGGGGGGGGGGGERGTSVPLDRGLAAVVARTGVTVRTDDIRTAGGFDEQIDYMDMFNLVVNGTKGGRGGGGGGGGEGGNPLACIAVPIRAATSPDVVAVLVAVGSPPGSVGAGSSDAEEGGLGRHCPPRHRLALEPSLLT